MTDGVPFGNYRLLQRLGRGGMGEVFLARAEKDALSRLVAVKRLLPELGGDRTFVARFLDEMRVVAQLSHPYLVQVYDAGVVDGVPFLAMEYVHGRSLAQLQALPWPVVARIGADLCEALEYAHSASDVNGRPLQLVHRDVTPSNVMVAVSGCIKLIDFGVARSANRGERTEPGKIVAKLEAVTPEQVRGEPVDARVDVYGVGLTLYELASGVKPFGGLDARATLEAIVSKPPPADGLPPELTGAVMACLEKQPARRPQSAKALRMLLEEALRAAGVAVGMPEIAAALAQQAPAASAFVPDDESARPTEPDRGTGVMSGEQLRFVADATKRK